MTEPDEAKKTPFGESFEDLETLGHLADQHGFDGLKVAAELLEDELRAKPAFRRLAEFLVAIAITVVIFSSIIPKYFDVEYRDVWGHLADIDRPFLGFMFVFWFFTMWNYAGVLVHSLPGLRRFQAMVLNFSGSALANVVPFGGAAGVGATYAQAMSWGLEPPAITLSIIVSGIWNLFAKLGMPIIVLALLFSTGRSSQGLGAAAIAGFAVLVGAIVFFALIFRSDEVARSIGRLVERIRNAARRVRRREPIDGVAQSVIEFRDRTVDLVRNHWFALSGWMVAYKASQAILQLMCARAVGVDTGVIEILAVYTFGELLTTIPITPSGVGFVETGATGLLIAFGAPNSGALAAVLLYRAFTYLFEIPLGGVGWLTWATVSRWRRAPASN